MGTYCMDDKKSSDSDSRRGSYWFYNDVLISFNPLFFWGGGDKSVLSKFHVQPSLGY